MKIQFNTLVQWFDNDRVQNKYKYYFDESIDWLRCIPFIGLHLGCFALFFVGWSVPAIITALILYAVRMFELQGSIIDISPTELLKHPGSYNFVLQF